MSEHSKRDWSWTPVVTIAGMHVMMTAITVTVMLFSYGDLNNRMLSVEEKLRDLIEVVSRVETKIDNSKQEVSK
ncbi:MAG: hypothetical protein F4042_05395 [Gemmatimonadetes bacterium]|nr:hypothetical protein [Gemmatimonadota bacterium]MYJ89262.1 hypothetical protein [Gemmatimonadota bacterium]